MAPESKSRAHGNNCKWFSPWSHSVAWSQPGEHWHRTSAFVRLIVSERHSAESAEKSTTRCESPYTACDSEGRQISLQQRTVTAAGLFLDSPLPARKKSSSKGEIHLHPFREQLFWLTSSPGPQPTFSNLRGVHGGSCAEASSRLPGPLRTCSCSRLKGCVCRKQPWVSLSPNALVKWIQNINVLSKVWGNNTKHSVLFKMKVLHKCLVWREIYVCACIKFPSHHVLPANYEFFQPFFFKQQQKKISYQIPKPTVTGY